MDLIAPRPTPYVGVWNMCQQRDCTWRNWPPYLKKCTIIGWEMCTARCARFHFYHIHLFETSPFRNHASALDSASGSVLSLDLTQVPIPYHRQKTIILWCSAFPNLFRTRDHDSYTLGTSRMRTGLESSLSSRLKPWARSKNNNNNIEVLLYM